MVREGRAALEGAAGGAEAEPEPEPEPEAETTSGDVVGAVVDEPDAAAI